MNEHTDEQKNLLDYWFGRIEKTALPSENRMQIWFGANKKIDQEIKTRFASLHEEAANDELKDWTKTGKGLLALIILFDQISRHIYRHTAKAYEFDHQALTLCMHGIEKEFDHSLSLIERVFYYFPLLHAESIEMQTFSVRAYQMLASLAFPETKSLYERFFEYAVQHYEIIKRFGRFPLRNEVLGRESTIEELNYIKEHQGKLL